MDNFLLYAVTFLLVVVLVSFFNEKVTKLTNEIALLLFSCIIGGIFALIISLAEGTTISEFLMKVTPFDIEDFLLNGVLCFMLFAGACHMKLSDFKRLARPVGVLSIGATLLGALFYGFLFYGVAYLMHLPFSLPMCLMFGSIVAPTDPIAATSILNKFGLPKDTAFLIEGESLLNDGVGVALFVCFSGYVTMEDNGSFLTVMLREVLGAVAIGVVVTFVFFFIYKFTKNEKLRICVTLLMVSLAYFLCEKFDCSGAIASVVCGVLFASLRSRAGENSDEVKEFDSFWDVIDNLLNALLYVILGLSFVRILGMQDVILLSLIAIVLNLIARFTSLFISTFLMGKLPDGYNKLGFSTLLTWGGLRGGLCIALAMSTSSMIPQDTYYIVLGCTYAIVFFTTVIQGLSMKKVYSLIPRKTNT